MLSDGRQQRPSYSFRPKADGNARFPEKDGNYSPSARYLYGGASQPHQHQHQHQHQQGGHRRDQFKGGGHFQVERLAKQNDVIIRLLKEIRDRLPAPPQSQRPERPKHEQGDRQQAQAEQPQQVQTQTGEDIESQAVAGTAEQPEAEQPDVASDGSADQPEPGNQ